MPVYIGKSGDLVGCYRCLTYSQTTEYSATQLVSSIKLKLSHAIISKRKQSELDCVSSVSSENSELLVLHFNISTSLVVFSVREGINQII